MTWRPGAYARDGMRIFGWLLVRAAAQAATVVLVARWLGAQNYGAFVSAVAVASFFTPLAGLGVGGVLLVRGARMPERLPLLQAQAARLWLLSSSLFSAAATAAMFWSLPSDHPLWALGALAVAEVAAASWVEIIARRMQVERRAHRFGAIQAGLPLARLVACGVAVFLLPASAMAWMSSYALASLLYVALLALLVPQPTRSAKGAPEPATALVREGAPFVTGALAIRLQTEFNKPLLAHLDYGQAGAFNVAQRVIDLAALPLAALQEALWPRLFAADRPTSRLWRTGGLLVALALLLGALLAMAAPLLPWLLGRDFAPAAEALVWLALLPAVQLVRNLGNGWLIARGGSQTLSIVYTVAAAAGVLLTLFLVPKLGLSGAVWATYGAEVIAILTQALLKKGGKT